MAAREGLAPYSIRAWAFLRWPNLTAKCRGVHCGGKGGCEVDAYMPSAGHVVMWALRCMNVPRSQGRRWGRLPSAAAP